MGDSTKGKSVLKRYEKPRVEARTENDGKLFHRMNKKTGRVETNLLEWEMSWKNGKILKHPTRFANELPLEVRENPTVMRCYLRWMSIGNTGIRHRKR